MIGSARTTRRDESKGYMESVKMASRVVPCGSCQACCKAQWVFLNPAAGDVVELYDTVEVIDSKTLAPARALAHKPNGDCIYLEVGGCRIHARAPAICRAFDCRVYYRGMMAKARTERKREIRDEPTVKEMFAIGREMERCHPLDEAGTASKS